MRWLYMPIVSSRNVQAASSYQFFLAFRRHALRLDPGSVFYVLTPKLTEGKRWQEGADWEGERTFVVQVEMEESQFDDLALVTREFWEMANERFGWAYFDVILSERPMLAPMLSKLAGFHVRSKSRRPLIVTRDQIVIDQEWFKVDVPEELLQVVGYASAPTIFQSPHQKARALTVCRRHLTASHLRRIEEESVVFPLGIDCDDVDEQIAGVVRHEQVTVNYSHKLFVEQKFLESLKIMDSVLAGGRDVRMQVVTGSSAAKFSMMPRARPYAYMEIHGSMSRSAFLRQMAKAQVFISNSYYEDFSATVVEQMYARLLPVLVDAPWSRYLVPDGYPYLFASMEEGQGMVRYVVDHVDEIAAEWVPKIRAKVKDQFDLQSVVPRMVQWMTALSNEHLNSLRVSPSMIEMIEKAYWHLPSEFDLADLYATIKKVADNLDVLKTANESRSTSPWFCVDVLKRLHPEMVDLGTRQISFRKAVA